MILVLVLILTISVDIVTKEKKRKNKFYRNVPRLNSVLKQRIYGRYIITASIYL